MRHTSIPHCFVEQVHRTPDAVALSEGDTRLTYRALNERANQVAHRLLDAGVTAGEPVALAMTRSVELVVAILGVLKAGASYLPVHEAYPVERAQDILDRANGPLLLADAPARMRGLPRAERVVFADDPAEFAGQSTVDPVLADADGGQVAYVMHTSGSTGEPKGVAVTHRGVLGLALDSCWDTGRHERVPMLAPHAFGVSTYEIWVPLLRGGTIVLPRVALDVDGLRTLVAEESITAMHLTAGLFRVVADEAPEVFAGVREVLTGGDVIAPAAVRRALEACPELVVRAMYGATELSSFAAHFPMTAPFAEPRTIPIGYPMDDVRPHVLDDELRPVGPGKVGELYIGGPRLALGYTGQDDLTAEKFREDPFEGPGNRVYRTGDLVRTRTDGVLEFVSRADSQVKIRGYRVELGEIESTLATHPSVVHATVVTRETELGGHRLIAYVVFPAGTDPVPATVELLADAARRLPDYMLPSVVVPLDRLPLTPNGKLDRAALPEPDSGTSANYRPPVTEREAVLCAVFEEVLDVGRVGMDDSFFDLEGNSLLAMRLISRIVTRFDVELTIADLFNAPTVSDLCKLLDDRGVTNDE
ncbi:non-ribosomal peptide synthetase [Amycolatopsis sp. NBC_01307]|uniref:non-ribosomal peptide synthetase n=1 Tax=Amycolatopsis sp. NBC_01307 TaxID=2903561 RepID=UPI002E0FAD5B|nr:non-ribosomal peptide synthetase [Amycolatopsis sp. NBC_01307]